ncbi:MAG: DNA cytosine methyltransferase [Caldilineaceae bacterium]|nr:DNA cytosine methyltransferase [Caldilineaceae bacterium]
MIERTVVDIFCGVGGLTHGLRNAGFRVLAGIDADEKCGYGFEHNNPEARFIHKKIEDLSPQEIIDLYPPQQIKILVGCAPCQPFSTYKKKTGQNDEKWMLLHKFAHLIRDVKPDIVSMENVPSLLNFDNGEVFEEFVRLLEEVGYHITYDVLYCPAYGIPQKRYRLVLFASLFGEVSIAGEFYAPSEYPTVRDQIQSLPAIAAGETDTTDPMHRARGLSSINLRRIQTSTPGGSWRDWEPDLVTQCHRKETGKYYNNVYGRMAWDEPAPTITTQFYNFGAGRFGHPEQDRALTLREGALLQTFPQDYEFVAPNTSYNLEDIGRLIGNAVPVELGRIIGHCIDFHLEFFEKEVTATLNERSSA